MNCITNKYKGFDNLLHLCLGHIVGLVNEGIDLGITNFVFFYSDFREEFPNEFNKFSFVSEYNFLDILSQYIDYENSVLSKYKTFNKGRVVIYVDIEESFDEIN